MRKILTVLTALSMTMGAGVTLAQNEALRTERVLTGEERAALTPEDVLRHLKEGNQRFLAGTLTTRDHSAQVRDSVSGQYPKALVLSCLDSRIPVEDVFDLGIGDLFVARVAGNFVNVDILGSMEFAGIHDGGDGVRLIVVMGHGSCGAIEHAIDGTEEGNITAMLANIRPAIDALIGYEGAKTSENDEFVHLVTEKNVQLTVSDIREHSSILKGLEDKGRIKIVGALYDMKSGEVEFYE